MQAVTIFLGRSENKSVLTNEMYLDGAFGSDHMGCSLTHKKKSMRRVHGVTAGPAHSVQHTGVS